MKSVLVIGAGQFGRHLAINLCDMGNEVMLVDENERVIEELSHQVTTAEIGDYTLKSHLEALDVEDYDHVFVCVGDFQDSLVIVDYLKELGAKDIIGKASSTIHEKFLLKNGADRVIYPERDVAYHLSVELTDNHVYDFIKLSKETGIYEIQAPDSWFGKSLDRLDVRRRNNVTIIAYRDSENKIRAINSPDYIFKRDEHIIVMGDEEDVNKITK